MAYGDGSDYVRDLENACDNIRNNPAVLNMYRDDIRNFLNEFQSRGNENGFWQIVNSCGVGGYVQQVLR